MSCATRVNEQLRARRLRITPQRHQVAVALAHSGKHTTIDELQQQIEREFGAPGIPTPTVYRTVETLKQHGLVAEVTSGRGNSRFERVDPERPHHHLVCSVCKADEQVDATAPDTLERALLVGHDFEAFQPHFVLTGICSRCRNTTPSRPAP
jgi:Fe2+ or Zn2+ uptake regulation protein